MAVLLEGLRLRQQRIQLLLYLILIGHECLTTASSCLHILTPVSVIVAHGVIVVMVGALFAAA